MKGARYNSKKVSRSKASRKQPKDRAVSTTARRMPRVPTIRPSQVAPTGFKCDLKLPGSQSKKETELDTKLPLTRTVKAFSFKAV